MASEVGYSEDEGGMIVRFNSGKTGVYEGVSEDLARSVANAASVGQTINAEIKGRFKFRYL
jgi:hypothetical protein